MPVPLNQPPMFLPGEVVATAAVDELGLPLEVFADLVARHVHGDWGNVDAEDAAANEAALQAGDRVLSAYDVAAPGGSVRLLVQTESDRKLTTIMLLDDL
jgi:hypothetical protein